MDTFLQWKVHPLVSSHTKVHRHICLELFSLVNSVWPWHISLLIQTRWRFHWNKAILWIEDSYFSLNQYFEVKKILMDLLQTLFFASRLTFIINWWTGDMDCLWIVLFYQPFGLSFWWHPFNADDTSVSKRCNGKCNSKLIYISDSLKAAELIFWVNYSLESM